MASYSYTRDMTEEDLKQEVHVYTKKELRANWWDYNLKWVLMGIAAAALVIFLLVDVLFKTQADYQIAIIGPDSISETIRDEIASIVSAQLDDKNGDGEVYVEVYSYTVDLSGYVTGDEDVDDKLEEVAQAEAEEDATVAQYEEGSEEALEAEMDAVWDSYDSVSTDSYYVEMAGQIQMASDLELGESIIFILNLPDIFEEYSEVLCYLDGTMPEDIETADWTKMVYEISECSILGEDVINALDGYYIARRNSTTDTDIMEKFEEYQTLWDIITEGATPYSEKIA